MEDEIRRDRLFYDVQEFKDKLSSLYGQEIWFNGPSSSKYQRSWKAFTKDFSRSAPSLPVYCKLPTVYSFIRDHYHYVNSNGDDLFSLEELKEVEEGKSMITEAEQKVIDFLVEKDDVSRPIPDHARKPLSMASLWKDFGNELKYLDPRQFHVYFSKMTDADVLTHLESQLRACPKMRYFGFRQGKLFKKTGAGLRLVISSS
jgi:hypothetical protein